LSLFAPETRTNVMTIRCMRKTLHTLPLPLAAAAHRATLHFRERDALRAVMNANMSASAVSRVTAAIVALLEHDGPLLHREIETRLIGRRMTVVAVRLALKLAWERGVLAYVNDTSGWNREKRKFALTRRSYPGLDMAMDRGKATGELVCAYFDRYGPASLRDVMWWSGLSRSAITIALNESGRDVVAVHASWCESPMYIYQDRLEEFRGRALEQGPSGLHFLAHEDVALKAYLESRRRYLGELPARRAFNQIGEALPTVALDGQVIGTWAWDPRARRALLSIARGYGSPELRRLLVRRQAGALSAALRRGWV
jgi:Winged helix DNA-binding domain